MFHCVTSVSKSKDGYLYYGNVCGSLTCAYSVRPKTVMTSSGFSTITKLQYKFCCDWYELTSLNTSGRYAGSRRENAMTKYEL